MHSCRLEGTGLATDHLICRIIVELQTPIVVCREFIAAVAGIEKDGVRRVVFRADLDCHVVGAGDCGGNVVAAFRVERSSRPAVELRADVFGNREIVPVAGQVRPCRGIVVMDAHTVNDGVVDRVPMCEEAVLNVVRAVRELCDGRRRHDVAQESVWTRRRVRVEFGGGESAVPDAHFVVCRRCVVVVVLRMSEVAVAGGERGWRPRLRRDSGAACHECPRLRVALRPAQRRCAVRIAGDRKRDVPLFPDRIWLHRICDRD